MQMLKMLSSLICDAAWSLSFLLGVHFPVGVIEHFIQRVAFTPFSRAYADVYPESLEMAGYI